jgi:hypothetical protein
MKLATKFATKFTTKFAWPALSASLGAFVFYQQERQNTSDQKLQNLQKQHQQIQKVQKQMHSDQRLHADRILQQTRALDGRVQSVEQKAAYASGVAEVYHEAWSVMSDELNKLQKMSNALEARLDRSVKSLNA